MNHAKDPDSNALGVAENGPQRLRMHTRTSNAQGKYYGDLKLWQKATLKFEAELARPAFPVIANSQLKSASQARANKHTK